MNTSTINRYMSHVTNEAIEVAGEASKTVIYGPDFCRDQRHTSIERIAMEVSDLLAVLDHMAIKGIDLTEEIHGGPRYNRKRAILRMEDALVNIDISWIEHNEDCSLPIPADEFKELTDFWITIEKFYQNYPVSLIWDTCDTINLLNTKSISAREKSAGKLTDREHAVCEYFHNLFANDGRHGCYMAKGIDWTIINGKQDEPAWYNPELWMAIVMLIRRYDEMVLQNKKNEVSFLSKELNHAIDLVISEGIAETMEIYGEEYTLLNLETVIKDQIAVGISSCEKIGIKIDKDIYIKILSNGSIEAGVRGSENYCIVGHV